MEKRLGTRTLLIGSALIQSLGLLAVPFMGNYLQMGAVLTIVGE